MRSAVLILVVSALGLAGCGGSSTDDRSTSSTDATAAGGARPVSPNADPSAEAQAQAIVNRFTGCARERGYAEFMGPPIPGGASARVAKVGVGGSNPTPVFIVFPDSTAAALAAQRDRPSAEAAGGGIARAGLTELVAYRAASLEALRPCVQAATP